jgi:hypothetical protein
MSPARAGLAATLFLALPVAGRAQGLAIDHKPVGCIVAGKYPRLQACFTPAGDVVKPRVNFRLKEGAASAAAYYVEMTSDMPCHFAFLPRPKKELIGQDIEIWIEGMDRSFNPGRTPEYAATVVGSEAECRKDLPVAPWVSSASVTVLPGLPAGFVASAVPGLGVLGMVAGGTVLAGTGVYVATKDDNDPPPVQVAPTPPTPTPAPTPVPTPTPTPPPGTTPTLDCTIRPRSGPAPLDVSLSAVPSGFSGPVSFRWDFGDGTSSTDRDTTHTYTAPGVFRAIVFATSGSETATCDRNVSVSRPDDVRHTLAVTLLGSGGGLVTSNPGGVSCAPDCGEVYPSGTVVTLTAAPDGSSVFVGWGGACSGTGACTVTMNADQAVAAKFDPKVLPVTLTVALSGKGAGTVTADTPPGGITCPSDCAETYPAAPVTVTLRAAPQINSFFAGWGGGVCTGTGPCTLTLTADTTVTAAFEPTQVTLNLTCTDDRASTTAPNPAGSVSVTPSILVCNSNGRPPVTVSNVYSAGTNLAITATATPGTLFTDWGGACASLGRQTVSPSTCNLTVPPSGPVAVTVHFTGTGTPIPVAAARPAPAADDDGIALAWRHQLDLAGGTGQVLLNGATTVASGPGLNSAQALGRPGENRLEGRVTRATGRAGTWRFELGANLRLEPGSIRILAGEPAVVTGDAVVFRLRGRPGEQVAFTFRLKR